MHASFGSEKNASTYWHFQFGAQTVFTNLDCFTNLWIESSKGLSIEQGRVWLLQESNLTLCFANVWTSWGGGHVSFKGLPSAATISGF